MGMDEYFISSTRVLDKQDRVTQNSVAQAQKVSGVAHGQQTTARISGRVGHSVAVVALSKPDFSSHLLQSLTYLIENTTNVDQ